MEPIRVAQVMGYMNGGGVESVVMNYYRHIDRDKVQFDFIVCEGSTLIPREEIESLGGRIFMVPDYKKMSQYVAALISIFKRENWKIVHSHMNSLSVFPLYAAKKAGIQVRIAHSHSTSGKGEPVKNALKAVLKTQANRYPTSRFACGELAGRWLFGDGSDFEVIYNAVDLARFAFDADVRSAVRTELGVDNHEFVIGHVGRFMPQKNQGFLIDAFAEMLHSKPYSVLVLVGVGDGKSIAERRAAELEISDRVMFLGQQPEVNRLYQAFDAFALPSQYEGLCLVGIEAQAAGLPCLLSDAVTREVDLTGTCGFLPIGDPSVWARSLCSVRPRSDCERSSVDFSAFASYDIHRQAERLMERYQDLLEGFV